MSTFDGRRDGSDIELRDQSCMVADNITSLEAGQCLEELRESNVAYREDIPPDGGYGWVCVVCVFLVNAHTWGVNSAWAIFLAHYRSTPNTMRGTTLQFALIGGLSISCSLVISPVVAMTNRKFGMRITMLIGTAIVFLSLLTSSFATKVWHLFLTQGATFGIGMGFLYITASAVLPRWFSSRRSLAVGLSTSGAGLGGLAYVLVTGHTVNTLGVPWSYRILAFSALAANGIASLLLRERPQESLPRQKAFNARNFTQIEVWLIVFWGTVTELGYITLLYSLPSYALSIGLSSTQGSVAGAMLNLGLGLGRPVIGYYSDKLGRINMAMSMTLWCGILCLSLWIAAQSYAVLLVFALLSGCVCGIFWGTISPILMDVVGLKEFGSTWTVILFVLVLPTTFGEPIAMQIAATTGGMGKRQYLSAQVYVGCMFIAGALSLWLLRGWRIGEVERKAEGEHRDVARRPEWSGWEEMARDYVRRLFVLRKV